MLLAERIQELAEPGTDTPSKYVWQGNTGTNQHTAGSAWNNDDKHALGTITSIDAAGQTVTVDVKQHRGNKPATPPAP